MSNPKLKIRYSDLLPEWKVGIDYIEEKVWDWTNWFEWYVLLNKESKKISLYMIKPNHGIPNDVFITEIPFSSIYNYIFFDVTDSSCYIDIKGTLEYIFNYMISNLNDAIKSKWLRILSLSSFLSARASKCMNCLLDLVAQHISSLQDHFNPYI